jgi:hypothetical protein
LLRELQFKAKKSERLHKCSLSRCAPDLATGSGNISRWHYHPSPIFNVVILQFPMKNQICINPDFYLR